MWKSCAHNPQASALKPESRPSCSALPTHQSLWLFHYIPLEIHVWKTGKLLEKCRETETSEICLWRFGRATAGRGCWRVYKCHILGTPVFKQMLWLQHHEEGCLKHNSRPAPQSLSDSRCYAKNQHVPMCLSLMQPFPRGNRVNGGGLRGQLWVSLCFGFLCADACCTVLVCCATASGRVVVWWCLFSEDPPLYFWAHCPSEEMTEHLSAMCLQDSALFWPAAWCSPCEAPSISPGYMNGFTLYSW